MKTIVVVEDNETIAHLIRHKLRKEGYQVIWKADGPGGLAAVQENRPDLVLLDVMLPKMSGIEILENLKADEATQHIPVIMVTALASEKDVAAGLERGAADYVVKPLRVAELVIRVNKLTGGPSAS